MALVKIHQGSVHKACLLGLTPLASSIHLGPAKVRELQYNAHTAKKTEACMLWQVLFVRGPALHCTKESIEVHMSKQVLFVRGPALCIVKN